MMVSSAVLGAAAGTGLALFIAVTIVVYRYYSAKRKIMSWSSLDRWPDPAPKVALIDKSQPRVLRQQLNDGGGGPNDTPPPDPEACRVLGYSRKSHTCYKAMRMTPSRARRASSRSVVVEPSQSAADNSGTASSGRHATGSLSASRAPPVGPGAATQVPGDTELEAGGDFPVVGPTTVVLEALRCAKVTTDKLSEVLGDVLELACGGGGQQPPLQQDTPGVGATAADGAGTTPATGTTTKSTASSRIGAITGVAIIRGRWTQRQQRLASTSSTNTNTSTSTSLSCSSTLDSQDGSQEEFSVAREQHAVQPSTTNESGAAAAAASEGGSSSSLQGRRCSRMGLGVGRALSSLSRRASSGSQEQLPATSEQQQQQSLHHHPLHHQHHLQQQPQSLQHAASVSSCSPSPQIRAYAPDGSHHNHETLHAASSYPPCRGSRSPSPVRAASLDTRCTPLPTMGHVSSSLSSLASSHAGSVSGSAGFGYAGSSSSGSNSSPKPPATPGPGGRCLSPLLIPPRASFSLGDSGSLPPASPLGALQPDLYRKDGPLFLSNTRRTGKSIGQLHLRLSYDFDKSDLNVHLIEAQELAAGDQGGFTDPYVKLTLSPEVDTRKRQTSYHHNDSNPVFDQHFKFPVSHEELQDKTLLLQVLDYDRFSRNDVVGSVRIPLEELDITSTMEVWSDISRERKPPEETQEVCISLSYLPSAERLTLTVLKARNLFTAPGKESLDPFVKVALLCGEKRVKKKKTATRKATRCPLWNEAMTFNVPASSLSSSAIEICVLDASSEQSGNNAIVGSCIIGPGMAGNLESGVANPSMEHWLQMTHSPRETIVMWHTLH